MYMVQCKKEDNMIYCSAFEDKTKAIQFFNLQVDRSKIFTSLFDLIEIYDTDRNMIIFDCEV